MIVVFGSINADLSFAMHELPAPGQTLLAREMRIEPGGKGANQAVAAARDGAGVVMAGAVGRDALAETALEGLRRAGVDLSRVAIADGPTGCACICTDAGGRNQIAIAPGANALARAAQVEDALLRPGTILVLQMETDPRETAQLILRARSRNVYVMLNLAPAAALDPRSLRAVDLLVVNEDEAAWLGQHLGSGDDAEALQRTLGVGVIRTLGAEGAEAADTRGLVHAPALRVEVKDTTAAGDCFVGVLAAGLDRGAPLADAMRRAGTAAAIACTRSGSQGSLPGGPEIDLVLSRNA
jgi:ribokinase